MIKLFLKFLKKMMYLMKDSYPCCISLIIFPFNNFLIVFYKSEPKANFLFKYKGYHKDRDKSLLQWNMTVQQYYS